MGTDVEVTFSHLRSKQIQTYFDGVLYFSINSICVLLEQLTITYALWLKNIKMYTPIHFTIKIDVEVTFAHHWSIPIHKYFDAVWCVSMSATIVLYI